MKVKTIITYNKQHNVYRIKAYHKGKRIKSYNEYTYNENLAKLSAVLFETLADYVDNIEDFNYRNYYLVSNYCIEAFNFFANINLLKEMVDRKYKNKL